MIPITSKSKHNYFRHACALTILCIRQNIICNFWCELFCQNFLPPKFCEVPHTYMYIHIQYTNKYTYALYSMKWKVLWFKLWCQRPENSNEYWRIKKKGNLNKKKKLIHLVSTKNSYKIFQTTCAEVRYIPKQLFFCQIATLFYLTGYEECYMWLALGKPIQIAHLVFRELPIWNI